MRIPILLVLFVSAQCSAQTWTQLADFPGTPRDDAAAFTVGGKIYVGTGREVGFGYTTDWFCYDPAIESWSAISSMPTTGRQYCTTFTIADTGYVFGGTGATGANNELWAYHPGTDSWEQKASLPAEPRFACAGIGIYFNMGLIATGMLASGSPTNEAWKYWSVDDTWEATGAVPGPARHRATCFEAGGGMEILGGADSAFNALADAWWYPGYFETGSWYEASDLPAPRYGADASGSEVYVITCGASDDTVFHAETWQRNGNWETLPDLEGGIRRGGAGIGTSGPQAWASAFYYGLGLDGTFARRNDWWRMELPVGIEMLDAMAQFSIYPVPANDVLTVSVRPEAIGGVLSIATLDGRIIHRDRIMSELHTVDASTYANGTYLFQLTTSTGASTRRAVLQH